MQLFRKFSILIILFFYLNSLEAQINNPVTWSFSQKQLADNEIEISFIASIQDGWHLYSQFLPEGGPIGTTFNYNETDDVQIIGKATEPAATEEYDKNFDMVLKYFSKSVTFLQKVKVNTESTVLRGNIEFMSCDDQRCTPPQEVDFEFNLKGKAISKVDVKPTRIPVDVEIDEVKEETREETQTDSTIYTNNVETVESNLQETNKSEAKSLWGWFFLAFGSGLLAILTPCVFPMIPMTVAFFMNDTKSKVKARLEGITYGISIVLIYTLVGTVVAVTLGANFANFLSTHWVPNVFFFLIFLFFAASFFGMFEITLPGWMINKADRQADKGGFAGAFFMAFTLVLVSFSCTGPIVGAILVASAGGEILMPIIGMLGFSLAFALPFTVFAIFPSLLSNLPKSGGWLNSVKVVLGFLELALGLKFLSIADQTYHWNILDREVYLALWIVIFILMGFYLLGKIKFSHDSDIKHLSVPRLAFSIITFAFVVYMIPGMFGAPLKALAGYLPPTSSLDFNLVALNGNNVNQDGYTVTVQQETNNTLENQLCETPKFSDFLHMPHGLKGYFDYDQALKCSKLLKKPLFIDFTGWGCVNCREMEANVWSDPRVLKRLREDYIIVALYVDDRKELPQEDWVTSEYDGKVKKTVGKKFADLQITKFKVNSQPYYVILDTEGEIINTPKSYDLNVENFIAFLDNGVKEFSRGIEK